MLDQTYDQSQPSRVETIENVHATDKKKEGKEVAGKVARRRGRPKLTQKTRDQPEEEITRQSAPHMIEDNSKRVVKSSRRKTSFDFVPPKQSSSMVSSGGISSSRKGKIKNFISLTSCDKEDKVSHDWLTQHNTNL